MKSYFELYSTLVCGDFYFQRVIWTKNYEGYRVVTIHMRSDYKYPVFTKQVVLVVGAKNKYGDRLATELAPSYKRCSDDLLEAL